MLKRQAYQRIASYEAQKGEAKKIVLLFSGSFYTSVLIAWLSQTYKADVIALVADIGQKVDFDAIKSTALSLGAKKAIVVNAKETFAQEYLTYAIKANGTYQGQYHLLSPLSRPLLAKLAVDVAEEEGASAIAHGCSAQSNDQIRLDGTILALNPDMKIISPLREGTVSRADALQLAKKYKITKDYEEIGYSYDENLWGVSIIGGDIENAQIPSRIQHLLHLTTIAENAPDVAERVTIDFEQGIPTKLNGKALSLVELITELNTVGGRHGVGFSYTVEDMILGIKNRSIDEQPGAEILISAHRELEKYVSTREENEFKGIIDTKWAYLCHDGKWLEPLMTDLHAYINSVNKKVTGKVTARLYRGNLEIISIETPKTIFEKKLATFIDSGVINQRAVAGYIDLATLSMRLANRAERTILLSIGKRTNKFKLLPLLRGLDREKYRLYATYKTHKFLKAQDIDAIMLNKIHQPHLKPNLADLLSEKRFDLIISIPSTKNPTKKEQKDSEYIVEKAKEQEIPLITSMEEAEEVLEELQKEEEK